jgi:hypothetical protein
MHGGLPYLVVQVRDALEAGEVVLLPGVVGGDESLHGVEVGEGEDLLEALLVGGEGEVHFVELREVLPLGPLGVALHQLPLSVLEPHEPVELGVVVEDARELLHLQHVLLALLVVLLTEHADLRHPVVPKEENRAR